MKKKIFKSLFLSVLLILALAIAMMTVVLSNYLTGLEQNLLQTQAAMAGAGIESAGSSYLSSLTVSGYRLTWVAKDGKVLYDSEADPATMENHASRQEIKEAMESGTGESTRYSATLATRTMYYALRLSDHTVIRVAIERSTIGFMLLRLASPILWIVLAAMAIMAFVSTRVSERIVEPLNHMDLDHPMANRRYEELTPLLMRIDRQNSQIDDQINQLNQRRHEFEMVTSAIREGLVLLNAEGQILSINPAAMELFQAEEDPTGRNILFLSTTDEMRSMLERAMHNQDASAVIHQESRSIRMELSPIVAGGRLTGFSLIAYDVSAECEAEEQRREFTANVSHELKTPLQSIMGSAELLESNLVKPEDQPGFVKKIYEESKRLLALIDDIIQLSELDESTMIKASEKLNLKDIVHEAQDALEQSAVTHHVTLNLKFEDSMVLGNARLMYEIAYNLMDNAIRYNRENGSVTVSTFQSGSDSVLQVQDTGIGIPHESLARIFERFYRVDKSHSRKTGGTGLGLSIVKHAVEVQHGRVTVDSTLGQGSAFTVTFPKISA